MLSTACHMMHSQAWSLGLDNKPLQTDKRRALVAACREMTLAPLAAERQNR